MHPDMCQTLAYYNREGKIINAVALYNYYPKQCITVDGAFTGTMLPRYFLSFILLYVFGQLRLKRLTFYVAASNLKSIGLVEKLGAYREATLQDGCSDGDQYIYCLRPESCPIWSIIHGKFFNTQSA